MARPSGITEEQLAAWDKSFEDFDNSHPRPTIGVPREVILEVHRAGQWLGQQLQALEGLDDDERMMTKEASGQIMVGRDPWDVVQKLVEDADRGVMYRSGEGLARALVEGALDKRFGPGADLTAQGIQRMCELHGVSDVSELVQMLMKQHGCATLEELQAKMHALSEQYVKEFNKRGTPVEGTGLS